MIIVRQETPNDFEQVYPLIKVAFATAAHSDGTEQDLVVRLRSSASFIPALSLVAQADDKIAGYILFTQIGLGQTRALGLAPLAVLPEMQGQGIGTRLIEEGHRIAREMGYEWSVVLGSEAYYPRAGYRPASRYGITPPFDVPDENFMALNLQGKEGMVNAAVQYDKAFFA